VARPLVELTKIQDPNWFAGFESGDGGFMVTIGKTQSTLTGIQVGLIFNVGQNSRDTLLFKSFINYLGCGAFYSYPKESMIEFRVTKISDFNQYIIPFFQKYPIHGIKAADFKDICIVALLIQNNSNLTEEGGG